MRKDVRLGMAIGGVLLLLVVVYLVITSVSHNPRNPVAASGNESASPGGSESGGGGDQSTGAGIPVTRVDTGGSVAESRQSPAPSPLQAAGENAPPRSAAAGAQTGAGDSGNTQDSGQSASEGASQGSQAIASNDQGRAKWLMVLDGQHDAAADQTSPSRQSHSGSAFQDVLSGDAGTSGGSLLHGGSPAMAGDGAQQTSGDVIPGDAIALTGSRAHRFAAASQPTGDSAATGARTHVVAPGETYSKISAAVYGTSKYYALIEKANPGLNPNNLKPGTVIRIPELPHARSTAAANQPSVTAYAAEPASATINPATEYRVQSGDSLYRISERLYGDASMVQKIYDLNKDAIGSDMKKLKLNMVLKLPAPPRNVQ